MDQIAKESLSQLEYANDIPRRVSDIVKNYGIRKQLDECDLLVSPTRLQRAMYPIEYRRKIQLLHEGVDTDWWCPCSSPSPRSTMKTITYVSRGLEPTRKFMEFIRALKLVLESRTDCVARIIGKDQVYYSDHKGSFLTMAKDYLGKELCGDTTTTTSTTPRVVFMLDVPRATVLETLQRSDVHVYFTDVFVPSWSLLEAMSCGCVVVASDNAACREFITNETSGLLVDHSKAPVVRNVINRALNMDSERRGIMGQAARNVIVEKYSADTSERRWGELLESLT